MAVVHRYLQDPPDDPDARRLDLGWLARLGYITPECWDDRVEVAVDLGGGHEMLAVVSLPAGFDWLEAGVVEIDDDGVLVVGGDQAWRWDLGQVLWRPA